MYEKPDVAALETYETMHAHAEAEVRRIDGMLASVEDNADAFSTLIGERTRAYQRMHVISRLIGAWHADVAERERNRLRSL